MNKGIAALVVAVFLLVGGLIVASGTIGYNNDTDYQIHQAVTGSVTTIDKCGPYLTFFPHVSTYPRAEEKQWTQADIPQSPGDESFPCKFNDAGKAKVDAYVKIQLPTSEEQRRLLFRETNGNAKNVENIVRAHLVNVINVTGPMMSATEHQSAKSAEFTELCREQLKHGLYKTRVNEVDSFDTNGDMEQHLNDDGSRSSRLVKLRIQKNEIVRDKDGNPVIPEPSPLERYGISIVQFSITATDYDDDTDKQFAARKQSILAGEQAKALKAQQIQERLMVEEKGKRELAEVTAEMNKEKERATIAADQRAEVAKIAKDEAVTKAMQKTEVAEQERQEAIKRRDIADIATQTAELTKKAVISQAEARKQEIEIGGGITEKEKVLATINADRDARVAEALSKVNVPGVVIVGNGDGKSGGGLSETLMNLVLLDRAGVTRQPVSSHK